MRHDKTIKYLLSEEGRMYSLLNSGDDDSGEIEYRLWRCIEYDEEDNYFDYRYKLVYFDTLMTAEQLLDWERKRLEKIKKILFY